MVSNIPKSCLVKTVVLGPDSYSLVFRRFFRIAKGFNKIKFWILFIWFLLLEKFWIKKIKSLIVVGKSDVRWIKKVCSNEMVSEKIHFLSHPLLKQSLTEDLLCNKKENLSEQKRFVFAGDLSKQHYVGDYIEKIVGFLTVSNHPINKIDFLIVGKNNYWVFKQLGVIPYFSLEYVPWVEDYTTICRPGVDIHCVPLMAGGGTKNRVMTAVANGVEVISTPIGTENIIRLGNPSTIKRVRSAEQFANAIVMSNSLASTSNAILSNIQAAKQFREIANCEFERTISNIFKSENIMDDSIPII
jgi:hypothetical protein